MKLYISPGACSLSPHIVFREAGLDVEIEAVHLGSKRTKGGDDFRAINPKGYVPALKLDDGSILTEGPAIVQYLADQKPDSKLAPPAGTLERYRLQEWLTYVGTEIHKQFSALFGAKAPDEWKKFVREEALPARLEIAAKQLERTPFLMGETFTVADAYLFTVLRWTKVTQIDLARWPSLVAFVERVGARPAVKAALEAEENAKK